jgi:predicted nuclease with TOPRIM domain
VDKLKMIEKRDLRSNVTSLESDKVDEIKAFYIVQQELSKLITEKEQKEEDVFALKKSLDELEKHFTKIINSLDKFEISKN